MFDARDIGFAVSEDADPAHWVLDGPATLHKAAYARIVRDYLGGKAWRIDA